MKRRSPFLCVLVGMVLLLTLAASCGDDDDDSGSQSTTDDQDNDDTSADDDDSTDDDDHDDNDDDNDDDDNDSNPGDPIEPSQGYLDRKAAFLAYCDENAGPDGGIYSQACAAYTGSGNYDEDEIYRHIDLLINRTGNNCFRLQVLLRLIIFDRKNPSLPSQLRDDLEQALLGYKYWLDEPGDDEMGWNSENQQILHHTAELIAGQLFPNEVFSNSGMTGLEHIQHAEPRVSRWLKLKGRFGIAEWNSNVYMDEDMPALINLAEFSEDEGIAARAAMILDSFAFNFAMNYYKGYFNTTRGRTYPERLLGGLRDSTREAAWIILGLGQPGSIDELNPGNFSACVLATSEGYFPPPIIEDIAEDARDFVEHRQSNSIDLDEGPELGIGFESQEDILFWWGLTAFATPEVVSATFQMIEDYDLWDGEPWSDFAFLRFLVGSPILPLVTEIYEPMSRGVALEAVNTYTYRTPRWQLSGAQDYKPGYWAGQNHIWMATLDQDSYVFTTYPGGLEDDYMGGEWTGGWTPRATFFENIGMIQYQRPRMLFLDGLLFVDYSHAYFPKLTFDQVVETGSWVIGKKADAYVALYSQNPTYWSQDNDYELISDAKENVWIIELGDMDSFASFDDFIDAIENATVTIGNTVVFESPSQGTVEVGWTGPMTVDGNQVNIGPHERWDNAYCYQPRGENVTVIEFDGQRLELDFEMPSRRYWESYTK